jgi:hypothetical protein
MARHWVIAVVILVLLAGTQTPGFGQILGPRRRNIEQREAFKSGKMKGSRLFVSGTAIDGAKGNPIRPHPDSPLARTVTRH